MVMVSAGGAQMFWSGPGSGQPTTDGSPAWTSVVSVADGRRGATRASQRAGRVSRIRTATMTPEIAVKAATARIAARASNLSARSPTRTAPTAKPRSRQKR